ncbi:nicastrin isoform X1 [Carya illinoinensis]|uniref:nicastrin isoform X1 n=1 Tax=Carya illinoinensis TaxID=32201 RepID=UPI001C7266B9|nr:nicastrin isoform X1 [Carya illinoinensis]
MAIKFLYLLLLFNFHLRLSVSGQLNSMESVPDLQKSMYKFIDGYPCVRLLNLSGVIGCSNPGREMVVAPIVRYKNAIALSQPSAVLVSSDEIQSFFTRIWHDSSFAGNIAGVIVESENEFQNKSKGFSPAGKFPLAEFAPYQNTSYEWNPIGSGIMWNAYDFPVFLLSESSTLTLQEAAIKNEKSKKAYIADVAEFDLVMQTTKAGTHDSETCLKEETCLPLGGYSFIQLARTSKRILHKPTSLIERKSLISIALAIKGSVWSSLPPINVSSSDQSKPIILTMASMDSASFFRDKSLGADSPLSGLISLLAAIDALSHVDGLDDLTKQLVFIFFTGESWGYLGSRRFLYELDLQSEAVRGLNNSLIEMAIEIGSVGKGFNQGIKRFYTHTAEVSSATNETLKALKHAQDSLKSEHIIVSPANASNPGIPPSSLMSFLRKNSLTSGLVLEDFDSVFSNKFYHSHLDNISNINSSAIVAAASLVARTLYILASDNKSASGSALTGISVNVSLVEELMGCLLDCDPGLSCELVKEYISPNSTCPNHYAGVILDEPSFEPPPGYVDDMSRFLWNFLADRTSIPSENASSSCSQGCSNKGAVCVREETDGKGICVISTTRYVPAYSTRLKFESGIWTVLPPNSSDPMGMLDPVWTESNWNAIGLRVYTVQDAAYDRIVLVAGISVTVLAYLAIVTTRAVLTKALKRD